jgi:hypothetical protein
MKIAVLHETTTVGAIAIKPSALGEKDSSPEIIKPRGVRRWYLAFAEDPVVDGLMENEGQFGKSPRQFGDQTSQPKKLVWQPLEKKHSKAKKSWEQQYSAEAKPPRQSSPHYPPPDKDYSDFIIGK